MNYFFSNHELPKPASQTAVEIGIERLIEVSQNTNNSKLANKIDEVIQNQETRLLISTIFGNSRFLSECVITDINFFITLLHNGPQNCFDEIKTALRRSSGQFQ